MYVLVSDIHGNALALSQVVEREGRDVEYIVLGDIHGLLAQPAETLELVRSLDGVTLAGNHDKAIFEHGEGHVNSVELSRFELTHTLSELSDSEQEYMRNLPHLDTVERGDSRICLCHAYPYPERASGYEPSSPGIRKRNVPTFASQLAEEYDYLFHGHTHEQYSLNCERFGHDIHFVNPGSLGYNGTYATVDVDSGAVSLEQVDIDWDVVRGHVSDVMPADCPSVNEWL